MPTLNPDIAMFIWLPIVSGLIGWVTNYIAVKMVFRPRQPWRFLGITVQGLIPRRRHELALSIGETVESELVSHRDVQEVLRSAAMTDQIQQLVDEHIDAMIQKGMKRLPVISVFSNTEIFKQVRQVLVAELRADIPKALESLLPVLEKRLHFQSIIAERIEALDLAKVEELIYRIASRELKAIELWGGVLGFMIGLLQAFLVILTRDL